MYSSVSPGFRGGLCAPGFGAQFPGRKQSGCPGAWRNVIGRRIRCFGVLIGNCFRSVSNPGQNTGSVTISKRSGLSRCESFQLAFTYPPPASRPGGQISTLPDTWLASSTGTDRAKPDRPGQSSPGVSAPWSGPVSKLIRSISGQGFSERQGTGPTGRATGIRPPCAPVR